VSREKTEHTRPRQWRSLEELAADPEVALLLEREFPERAGEWLDPVGRRSFLKLMGASLALAGLTSCTSPPGNTIVPYARAPEELIPGKPLFYATAFAQGGIATGLLVESHEGRPTKIEGNPQHPASLGATDAFAQASILSLYDPDRSQTVTNGGQASSWNAFVAALTSRLLASTLPQGAGLRILTETVTSPTLAWQIGKLLAQYPQAKWVQYEPAGRDAVRQGSRLAFGEVVNTVYQLDKAEVVLTLGSDLLAVGPGHLRYARDVFARRRIESGPLSRLYAVDSVPTLTGAIADHRLSLRQQEMEAAAWTLARALGVEEAGTAGVSLLPTEAAWMAAAALDLKSHRGAALVVAGDEQPPVVHALAHAINRSLGGVGQTVLYTDPVEADPSDQTAALAALAGDMRAGRVETLLILGGNPAYTAPADLAFAEALEKVPFRAHLGLEDDETSARCHWHLPEAHYLEAWGDLRAHDGTVTIQQPLIAPLYGGHSAHELLAVLLGEAAPSGYDILRAYWLTRLPQNFERSWRTALHDGVVAGTALPARTPAWKPTFAATAPAAPAFEILFRPDPTIWDGRFANNGWLQELPKPLTKLTWDNAAVIGPATAARLGLTNEDVVELALGGRSVQAPVWILPGHPADSVTVHLGYGRPRSGRAGSAAGFDAYRLRTAAAPWSATGLAVKKTGQRVRLASTQQHPAMEGRNPVRVGTAEELRQDPHFIQEMGEAPAADETMYPAHPAEGYRWGMAIDLGACIGCGACVAACQAENNTPVVGKDQVLLGRAMHWIRVDRYYAGPPQAPDTLHQPMLCHHCENAPCEPVCPVGATVHSSEGLNDMVYNRCVGTRYCSNNCPYKVRHFNFLQYADHETPTLRLLHNPNVTVRSRGVMEKCTYCVQRINAARIRAKEEDREIKDGDVVTACQGACPTQAIVFGNLNDPTSRVSQAKASARNYGVLADLNTRPRTTYLARLRNPNPEMEKA
jgi:MoCo/4Fe-4S cofactor protein with predicted Tat translocation signal